jgi:hypothetical protein
MANSSSNVLPWEAEDDALLKSLNTNASAGLRDEQVEELRKIHGSNGMRLSFKVFHLCFSVGPVFWDGC